MNFDQLVNHIEHIHKELQSAAIRQVDNFMSMRNILILKFNPPFLYTTKNLLMSFCFIFVSNQPRKWLNLNKKLI